MTEEDKDQVGGVAEEAAKLLGALQDWAKESRNEYADAAGSAAAGASDLLGNLNEHIATGGRECRYCPLCQVVAAVRDTSPEVKQHLTTAASSLMKAAAGILETRVPDDKKRSDSGVEKIDLSDDSWEDED